jgi:hypothetical protein
MAKATKKTIDENGEIVDVQSLVQEHELVSDIKIDIPEKKKTEPKEYIFQLTGKFYVNSVYRQPFPENYLLRNSDMIFDEDTNTERNIRYLEGVSTIFEDEQEHLSDQKKRQRPDIRFTNGTLRVPANKPSLVQFLLKSNMYDKKKNRILGATPIYTLLNFEEQEEKEVEKTERRMDAMKMAMDAPEDIMIPHAKYIGIKFTNQHGIERSLRAVRVDYLNFADKNAETFITSYNNPIVKAQYLVSKAMSLGLVDTSTIKGQAIWGDTKKFIVQIPDKEISNQFLAKFALTDGGKDFYSQLKSLGE